MTAHVLDTEKQKCLAAGMNAYVTKPIEQDLLLQTIADSMLVSNAQNGVNVSTSSTINLTYLYSLCQNNNDVVKQILTQLLTQLPVEIAALKNAIDKQNITELKKIVHNFKSTLSPLNYDNDAALAMEEFGNTIANNAFTWQQINTQSVYLINKLQLCNAAINDFINNN